MEFSSDWLRNKLFFVKMYHRENNNTKYSRFICKAAMTLLTGNVENSA
jgi:hypothetical protein